MFQHRMGIVTRHMFKHVSPCVSHNDRLLYCTLKFCCTHQLQSSEYSIYILAMVGVSINAECGLLLGGKQWHIWLRHCTTIWTVTRSIPDGVTGIFHGHIPSGRNTAPGVDSASDRNELPGIFPGW